MIVLLKDGTAGEVEDGKVGDSVIISLQDENGMPIKVSGIVEEILVEDD